MTDRVVVLREGCVADTFRTDETSREQERKHLAREPHDQVIQDLLSTNYQLEEIERSTF